jgi:hypothetical protein
MVLLSRGCQARKATADLRVVLYSTVCTVVCTCTSCFLVSLCSITWNWGKSPRGVVKANFFDMRFLWRCTVCRLITFDRGSGTATSTLYWYLTNLQVSQVASYSNDTGSIINFVHILFLHWQRCTSTIYCSSKSGFSRRM